VSDIDTAVVDGLKVLDPNGRLEKLPRLRATAASAFRGKAAAPPAGTRSSF
jgi:hypothetical protein